MDNNVLAVMRSEFIMSKTPGIHWDGMGIIKRLRMKSTIVEEYTKYE